MRNVTVADELSWRGLIKDRTFSDINWLNKPQVFYLGVDCSSNSLTIGNLAVFILARRLLEFGWKTVLLVGGATSMVGDPGGKDQERTLLSREDIQQNVVAIEKQVKKLFNNKDFQLVDNYDWFKEIGYLDFLREVGKSYSMTELVQRDFINERMGKHGSGISYAEFSYTLVQGYDYWHLFKQFGVVLQIGGSDQWGNMLSGVPLIRKKEGKEVHAMSMPLVINKTTGKKFGKSETGSIWLDKNKTSVFDFYQFWINIDDINVSDYLKVFTNISQADIKKITDNQLMNPGAREAQSILASEVTKLVHGELATETAKNATAVLLGNNNNHSDITSGTLSYRVKLPVSIIDLLADLHLVSSKTEARRLLNSNGIYINNKTALKDNLEVNDFPNGKLFLRRGKTLKDSVIIELDN